MRHRHLLAFACSMLACAAASAEENPLSRSPSALALNGRWNGVDLERRSSCTQPQNEGNRGTYAQFDIVADAVGNLVITQSGITGLNCTYTLRYAPEGGTLGVQGTYGCTDGKQGNVTHGEVRLHGLSFDLRMAIRLTGGETCEVDALLALARLP